MHSLRNGFYSIKLLNWATSSILTQSYSPGINEMRTQYTYIYTYHRLLPFLIPHDHLWWPQLTTSAECFMCIPVMHVVGEGTASALPKWFFHFSTPSLFHDLNIPVWKYVWRTKRLNPTNYLPMIKHTLDRQNPALTSSQLDSKWLAGFSPSTASVSNWKIIKHVMRCSHVLSHCFITTAAFVLPCYVTNYPSLKLT